jgi:DNA-binding CsgD family transcriptional regulator
MLASMSDIDPRAETPLVDWSELDVSGLLPTGTVTLLLADVEGSTRLWETQPEQMTDAVARLNQTVSETIAEHGGVRPVEQGEGDSFVAAFARASDAVAAALELQRAPLAPIRLRIGVHTGEIQLRDEGNYAGPTINRTARLRDLGHGGQTLLSGAALSVEEAVAYAQRGRGQRKRPTSGWGSLTPTERDVVRLVSEGLANNDIAARLFVSPRTVQTHLTHVYTKLGLTSRVQLAQEAARRADA